MQSSPRKKESKGRKKIEKQKVKMYIFSTEYISIPKDQTNEHEQRKQMNHKNKDVHIYSKYRLVFIFYMFLTIFIHITNT